jgi:hypothetical protein
MLASITTEEWMERISHKVYERERRVRGEKKGGESL